MNVHSGVIGIVETVYGEAAIHLCRYPSGGAIAVQLVSATARPEPVRNFSTNLTPSGARFADDEFCVKCWNGNEMLVAPMMATGLFEDTGRRVSGCFVRSPVWRVRNPSHVPEALTQSRMDQLANVEIHG